VTYIDNEVTAFDETHLLFFLANLGFTRITTQQAYLE